MAKKLKLETGKKKEKWNLFTSGEKMLGTELLKGAHTEIFGSSRIVVEGCLGVYEYNENYLKLRLKKGALVLCGCDFDISSFEEQTITVNGKIATLEFCD